MWWAFENDTSPRADPISYLSPWEQLPVSPLRMELSAHSPHLDGLKSLQNQVCLFFPPLLCYLCHILWSQQCKNNTVAFPWRRESRLNGERRPRQCAVWDRGMWEPHLAFSLGREQPPALHPCLGRGIEARFTPSPAASAPPTCCKLVLAAQTLWCARTTAGPTQPAGSPALRLSTRSSVNSLLFEYSTRTPAQRKS